jgi:hypothetical protein
MKAAKDNQMELSSQEASSFWSSFRFVAGESTDVGDSAVSATFPQNQFLPSILPFFQSPNSFPPIKIPEGATMTYEVTMSSTENISPHS